MRGILVAEEMLDPGFLPPKLVRRNSEFAELYRRYRESFTRGVHYHQLLTGGIGSGKTALANRIGEDLQRAGRIGKLPVLKLYVNCWRRANDRTILLELMRGVGVSIPDRGYSLAEMLDVFEQGLQRTPRHLLVVLDEVSSLVRQGTKLVYMLARSGEVKLGSISLFLVASEDVLPFLDDSTRSSFGVTHRLQLAKYDAEALTDILEARAQPALRAGSYSRDTLEQIARIAAPNGDARFAIELLVSAARAAEQAGEEEIGADAIRAAKGSIYPTVTEGKLEELSPVQLMTLLALARVLKGPGSMAPNDRVRVTYQGVAEEYGQTPVSRVTFWRTIKELEREGLLVVESASAGKPNRLGMDEVPTSLLTTLLESRLGRGRARKG